MAQERRIVYDLEFRTNIDEVINRIENDIDSLENSYDDLTDSIGASNEELAETGDGLNNVGDSLNNVSNLWGDFTTNLRSGDIRGAFGSVRTGIQGATRAAWAFIATPIGAAIAALVAIGAATKAWFDFNNQVVAINKNLEAITNETGAAVDSIRIRASALNDVFDVDLAESTKTAKKLVEQFGISYAEAFDSIEEGLIRGGTANDEYLDSLSEYGTFFATAGFSVSEFQGIVNAGFDLGIYADKLPDAIKEFDLKIREQTTATKDALVNSFGIGFSDELLNKINTGAVSTKEALELINEESKKVSLSVKEQATLTADLFGGAGEDAGGFAIILEAVNEGITSLEKPYNDIEKAQRKQIDNQKEIRRLTDEAFKSDEFVKFKNALIQGWDEIKISVLETIVAIKEVGDDFGEVFEWAGEQVTNLSNFISTLFGGTEEDAKRVTTNIGEFFKFLKDTILKLANPIGRVIDGIKAIGGAVKGALVYLNIMDSAEEKMYKKNTTLIEKHTATFKTLTKAQQEFLKADYSAVQKAFSEGKIGIIEYGKELKRLSGAMDTVKEDLKALADAEAVASAAALADRKAKNQKAFEYRKKLNAEALSDTKYTNKQLNKTDDYDLTLTQQRINKKKLIIEKGLADINSLNTVELEEFKNSYAEKLDLDLVYEEQLYANKIVKNERAEAELQKSLTNQLYARTITDEEYAIRSLDAKNNLVAQQKILDNDYEAAKVKLVTKTQNEIKELTIQNLDEEYKNKFDNIFKIKQAEDQLITRTAEERKAYLETNASDELDQLQTTYDEQKLLLEEQIGFELENKEELDFAIQQLDIAKADAEVLLAKETGDEIVANDKETKAKLKKNFEQYIKAATQLLGYWNDFDSAMKQAELNRAGDNQEKIDDIESKYAEKAKARAIAGILIDTAKGIMGIWGEWGELPWVAGAFTAILAGVSIAQIAAVQSQPVLADGGFLKGNLHNQGGIQYNGSEVEGGEFVMNRASTKAFSPIIETLNAAGNGQGRTDDVKDINFIDYDKLAAVINDKKVYVTTKDLNESLDDDDKLKVQNTF